MKRDLMFAGLGVLALSVLAPMSAHAAEDPPTVSEVVTVAPTPFGGGVDRDRLGVTVNTLTAEQLEKAGTVNLTDALQRYMAGVNVSDTQGNPFTNDLNYRGFAATPLQGIPQGIAVYLNGQRMNEAFGDTVNWDLLPEAAIQSADLLTNNPVFGLNSLGGALNLRAKDGLTWRGVEAEAQGGENGFYAGSVQFGWGDDNLGVYAVIDGGKDDGWRQNSESNVLRAYVDIGAKLAGGEVHLTAGVSDSDLGVVGPTPVDLLDADRSSVFTYPQTTANKAQFVTLSGKRDLGGDWNVQGGLRYRHFDQAHVDGNDGEFERCASTGPLANTLCLEDDAFPSAIRPAAAQFQILTAAGAPIACPVSTVDTNGCRNRLVAGDTPRVPYGTIDRTWTTTSTWGASFQFGNDADFSGMKNSFIAGASYDSSDVHFNSNSTLGLITPELEVVTDNYALPNITGTVPGLGEIIHAGQQVGYGPADVSVDTATTGAYVSNTLDVTQTLSLTVGGRYNHSKIDMLDLTGLNPQLTANHTFSRFNPAINLAWRTGGSTLFFGYSQTNRAPTPLELGCSDPTRPCLLENSLVSDPPLEQVVAKTWEAGIRGGAAAGTGLVSWSGTLFTTDNTSDIVALASNLNGRGYYANVPKTRRQGFEALVRYDEKTWGVFASVSQVQAEYRFAGTLASPNNPVANAAGNITIQPGDNLGGIPKIRAKFGGDVTLFDRLTLGADAQYTGDQYLSGDEGNDNDKLPSYWVGNLRADYKIDDRISLFARITNVTDEEYATFGTFFEAEAVQKVRPQPLPANPDEASVTPGQPRTFSIGLRARF